jgi:hypothetical protein
MLFDATEFVLVITEPLPELASMYPRVIDTGETLACSEPLFVEFWNPENLTTTGTGVPVEEIAMLRPDTVVVPPEITGAVTPPTVILSIASVPTVEKRSSLTVATVPAAAVFRLNDAISNVDPPTTYCATFDDDTSVGAASVEAADVIAIPAADETDVVLLIDPRYVTDIAVVTLPDVAPPISAYTSNVRV